MKKGATCAFFHSVDMIKSSGMDCHTVLIVEDEANVRRMLRAAVESLGVDYIVLDVPSAEEAMLVATHQPIQLLVTDIRLAGITGLDLIKKIRQKKQDLKVILITGLSEEKMRNQIAMAGADATFFKPINMDQFLDEVQLILGKSNEEPSNPAGSSLIEKMVPVDYKEILNSLVTAGKADAALFIDKNGMMINPSGNKIVDPEDVASILKIQQEIDSLSQSLWNTLTQGWLCLTGDGSDVWLFPVDTGCYLVLTTPVHQDEEMARLRQMRDVIYAVGIEQVEFPSVGGVNGFVTPTHDETPAQNEQDIKEFEQIFNPHAVDEIKKEQADSFWEAATNIEEPVHTNEQTLNYEQAVQMGYALEGNGESQEKPNHED